MAPSLCCSNITFKGTFSKAITSCVVALLAGTFSSQAYQPLPEQIDPLTGIFFPAVWHPAWHKIANRGREGGMNGWVGVKMPRWVTRWVGE